MMPIAGTLNTVSSGAMNITVPSNGWVGKIKGQVRKIITKDDKGGREGGREGGRGVPIPPVIKPGLDTAALSLDSTFDCPKSASLRVAVLRSGLDRSTFSGFCLVGSSGKITRRGVHSKQKKKKAYLNVAVDDVCIMKVFDP